MVLYMPKHAGTATSNVQNKHSAAETDGLKVVDPLEEQIMEEQMENKRSITMYIVYAVLVVLGVGTGYLLTRGSGSTALTPAETQGGKVAGVNDSKTFKDDAEGVLEAGGLDGEGTHKLIREGGPDKTAYLTSSIVDLDEFVGKKVKVWGQTMQAKKAGWLMDIGKIESLE